MSKSFLFIFLVVVIIMVVIKPHRKRALGGNAWMAKEYWKMSQDNAEDLTRAFQDTTMANLSDSPDMGGDPEFDNLEEFGMDYEGK